MRAGLLAAALVPLLPLQAAPAPAPVPSVAALDWPELQLLDGRRLAGSSLQQRPVILVFWASWCPFCKRHNDRLARIAAGWGANAPRVLALSVEAEAGAAARAAHAWGLDAALDRSGLRERLGAPSTLPSTCLIQPGGRLRLCIPGEMAEEDLEALRDSKTW